MATGNHGTTLFSLSAPTFHSQPKSVCQLHYRTSDSYVLHFQRSSSPAIACRSVLEPAALDQSKWKSVGEAQPRHGRRMRNVSGEKRGNSSRKTMSISYQASSCLATHACHPARVSRLGQRWSYFVHMVQKLLWEEQKNPAVGIVGYCTLYSSLEHASFPPT